MTLRWLPAGMCVALALAVAAPSAQQQGAELSGIVETSSPSPTVAAGALVMIAGTDVGLIRVTAAGPDGRFAFRGLPAGHFLLGASLPPRLPALYGAAAVNRPGQTIGLAAGQKLDGLRLTLAGGAAVEGQVIDETGQPLTGARVLALPRRQLGDEIQLAGDASPVITVTDDRGGYRISNLPPGDYVVAAQPRNPGFGNVRALTTDEVDGALAGRALPPDLAPAPGVGLSYAQVYYPDAPIPERATPVTLEEGTDRRGLDLRTHLIRQSRIDGSLSPRPSSMTPARNAVVTLRPRGSNATGAVINSFNAPVAPDGRFAFQGVPPGEYTLFARTLPPPVPPDAFGATPGALAVMWASRDVDVPPGMAPGLTVSLQAGLSVSGRVMLEGGASLPRDFAVRVGVRATPSTNVGPLPEPVVIDAAGRFTIANLAPGRYRLFATVPANDGSQIADWIQKTAMWQGRDVFDVPFQVGPDRPIDDVIVTLTSEMQQVSGVVRDATGHAVGDASVLIFSVDRALWFPQSRRAALRTSHADGEFVFGVASALPPGDYYVAVTRELLAPNALFDPALPAQLAGSARRVTVAPGANVSVQLTLK